MMVLEPLGETCFCKRRNIKVQLGVQLIDGRADPLEMFWHPYIVQIPRNEEIYRAWVLLSAFISIQYQYEAVLILILNSNSILKRC